MALTLFQAAYRFKRGRNRTLAEDAITNPPATTIRETSEPLRPRQTSSPILGSVLSADADDVRRAGAGARGSMLRADARARAARWPARRARARGARRERERDRAPSPRAYERARARPAEAGRRQPP